MNRFSLETFYLLSVVLIIFINFVILFLQAFNVSKLVYSVLHTVALLMVLTLGGIIYFTSQHLSVITYLIIGLVILYVISFVLSIIYHDEYSFAIYNIYVLTLLLIFVYLDRFVYNKVMYHKEEKKHEPKSAFEKDEGYEPWFEEFGRIEDEKTYVTETYEESPGGSTTYSRSETNKSPIKFQGSSCPRVKLGLPKKMPRSRKIPKLRIPTKL